MSSRAIPFHTFVVRYRLESTDPRVGREWRGLVLHLPGDESMHFRDPEQLLAFIAATLETAADESVSSGPDRE